MKNKCLIKQIEGYDCILILNDREIKLNIGFYDVKPKIGDILYLSDDILKARVVSIGNVNSKYGRDIIDVLDPDLVILVSNNQKIYLKRIYG